jgi:hypothetical protein
MEGGREAPTSAVATAAATSGVTSASAGPATRLAWPVRATLSDYKSGEVQCWATNRGEQAEDVADGRHSVERGPARAVLGEEPHLMK